jgi:hypothetical protein
MKLLYYTVLEESSGFLVCMGWNRKRNSALKEIHNG